MSKFKQWAANVAFACLLSVGCYIGITFVWVAVEDTRQMTSGKPLPAMTPEPERKTSGPVEHKLTIDNVHGGDVLHASPLPVKLWGAYTGETPPNLVVEVYRVHDEGRTLRAIVPVTAGNGKWSAQLPDLPPGRYTAEVLSDGWLFARVTYEFDSMMK